MAPSPDCCGPVWTHPGCLLWAEEGRNVVRYSATLSEGQGINLTPPSECGKTLYSVHGEIWCIPVTCGVRTASSESMKTGASSSSSVTSHTNSYYTEVVIRQAIWPSLGTILARSQHAHPGPNGWKPRWKVRFWSHVPAPLLWCQDAEGALWAHCGHVAVLTSGQLSCGQPHAVARHASGGASGWPEAVHLKAVWLGPL